MELQHLGATSDANSLMWTRGLVRDHFSDWSFTQILDKTTRSEICTPMDSRPVVTDFIPTDGSLQGNYRGGGLLVRAFPPVMPKASRLFAAQASFLQCFPYNAEY